MTRPLPLLSTLALTLACGGAIAQDTPDGLWHGNLSLGGAFSSGNNNSMTLSVGADTSRVTALDKINLYGVGNYGRSKVDGQTATTADLLRLGSRYDYNFSAQWFGFGGLEGETNKAAGVRNRYLVNSGVGYHLIRSDAHSFDLFGGASYTDTRFTDGSGRNGAQALLGEESSHKLSETASLKQRLVYYPDSSGLGTRVTFDGSLATQIAGGWTLNTGLSSHYTGRVPAGTRKTESLLTVGFGYKF
ncbi:MAG: hypothetical protein DI603_04625 [Roseateles depolymerans]|uniref:DUF481 domain-containing protein n=1 Tax=Roseateles depolymerans TaxID=76731 RepID=A0A2W5DT99_9BURK|nr:MAG: hypothetical protein DI603_04625 [Roseateles depolymerans]